MKIIVAIKQVPVRDSNLHIDASGRWIDEEDLSYEINEPDAYALEEALQLKEKHGGEVVAVLAGPERGGEIGVGLLALVVNDGGVSMLHQATDDIAAHPPQTDHAELHWCVSCHGESAPRFHGPVTPDQRVRR